MSITKICSCGYVGYAALHDKKGTDVVCEHFAKDIEAEATMPQEPVPAYSWSADGKTVTFTNYDECSATALAKPLPPPPAGVTK